MKTIINNLMASILLIIHIACVEKKESKSTIVSPKKSTKVDSSLTVETKTRTKEIVKTNQMERNKNLIGVWRNTEILSSGSGDNYMSFATDYFLEFQENGIILSWIGSSAGAGYYIASEDRNNADKGEWRTSENSLFLIDPVTKQEAQTYFYVENQRLLLSNEGSKKIFEKIQ